MYVCEWESFHLHSFLWLSLSLSPCFSLGVQGKKIQEFSLSSREKQSRLYYMATQLLVQLCVCVQWYMMSVMDSSSHPFICPFPHFSSATIHAACIFLMVLAIFKLICTFHSKYSMTIMIMVASISYPI